jgi:ElaB/YqjD/DUF883 family membrane-anchored ribosome-binding protein
VDNELEVIHHEMEEKRASLAEKLDTLENHVLGTVQEATEAVSHTVEDVKSVVDTVTDNVKETVESVTETVKHTFDIGDHVRNHPWGMFCGAVAAGFVGGRILVPARSEQEPVTASPPPAPSPPAPRRAAARSEEPESGMTELLQRVKGLALGALMKVVRDVVSEALPDSMKADVMNVMDDFTTKLGGKPVPASSASDTNGAHSTSASGEQTHEEEPRSGEDEPGPTSGERSQSGKKGQPSGGRFGRNPPPRR